MLYSYDSDRVSLKRVELWKTNFKGKFWRMCNVQLDLDV